MSILTLSLLFSSFTTFAAETNCANDEIMTYETETVNHLIDYCVKQVPYTSKSFRPKTDRICTLYGSWGNPSYTYTYYIEEQNSNGTWSVVDKHILKGGGTLSTSVFVTPSNTYRFRATSTDKYDRDICLEIYEVIYN